MIRRMENPVGFGGIFFTIPRKCHIIHIMNVFYNFDTEKNRWNEPVAGIAVPQAFVPFDNIRKSGWCAVHRKWEIVTIVGGKSVFSCGFPVAGHLSLLRAWTDNQMILESNPDAFFLSASKLMSYSDIHDGRIYQINNSFTKYFDFMSGRIYHRRDFDFTDIPEFLQRRIECILETFCARLFGVKLHVPKGLFAEFVRFPSCPQFSEIAPLVDGIGKFSFRTDINLFKDFCAIMKIRESKQLRRDFQKKPRAILLHAMAQFVGFRDANAIKVIAGNESLYKRFAEKGQLRFSIVRRCVYVRDAFYSVHGVSYNFNMLNGLRLWVQNALTDKTQIVVAKRFVKFMSSEPFDIMKDTVELYDKNARDLPVPLHERILKEGMTAQMHDQMLELFQPDFWGGYTSNEPHVVNEDIKYGKETERLEEIIRKDEVAEGFENIEYTSEDVRKNKLMMAKAARMAEKLDDDMMEDGVSEDGDDYDEPFLEAELELPEIQRKTGLGSNLMKRGNDGDFFFILPRTTDEMYEISTELRNCVGYLYRSKVLSGECAIVVLSHLKKLRACFEIRQNNETFAYEIVQASGACNGPIFPRYKGVIEEWMKRKNLSAKYEIRYR